MMQEKNDPIKLNVSFVFFELEEAEKMKRILNKGGVSSTKISQVKEYKNSRFCEERRKKLLNIIDGYTYTGRTITINELYKRSGQYKSIRTLHRDVILLVLNNDIVTKKVSDGKSVKIFIYPNTSKFSLHKK